MFAVNFDGLTERGQAGRCQNAVGSQLRIGEDHHLSSPHVGSLGEGCRGLKEVAVLAMLRQKLPGT
jgi:hypothetical protein